MSVKQRRTSRVRTKREQAAYDDGFRDGVLTAAGAVEREHINEGHHGPAHECRTRGWILKHVIGQSAEDRQ